LHGAGVVGASCEKMTVFVAVMMTGAAAMAVVVLLQAEVLLS
jgi:hypothetical protein